MDLGIAGKGALVAWDPVHQRQAWRVQHQTLWNGGTTRVLLWSDPDYARRMVGDARLYDIWHVDDLVDFARALGGRPHFKAGRRHQFPAAMPSADDAHGARMKRLTEISRLRRRADKIHDQAPGRRRSAADLGNETGARMA